MSSLDEAVQGNLAAVIKRINRAALAVSRDPASVTLLAVGKTFPAEAILSAAAAGQRCFGENYVQEGVEKIARTRELAPELAFEWHFIGPIQSNKTRPIAENFDWAHSVERLKIAQRLSEQRPVALPPLNVLLQINVSGEASKSGLAPAEAADLAAAVAALPRLRLRGLMAIPEATDDVTAQRAAFRSLRLTFDALRAALPAVSAAPLDTLSMGMSADLEAAIAEGSTLVRVGTAIFGQRAAVKPDRAEDAA
ncbi:MAG: YggS family pyridoxal phosphate-dependent enzyme [Burkholderiales bacterium]|jgi:pyridoxal phosphate enzyme (YggS family)|nr:YggS family pyridoxal phosphate-dependent enzyme [Burkholderiales bacterium]